MHRASTWSQRCVHPPPRQRSTKGEDWGKHRVWDLMKNPEEELGGQLGKRGDNREPDKKKRTREKLERPTAPLSSATSSQHFLSHFAWSVGYSNAHCSCRAGTSRSLTRQTHARTQSRQTTLTGTAASEPSAIGNPLF